MQKTKNNFDQNRIRRGCGKQAGFTLLVAIVVTGILLLVSFIVADLALKQLVITSANQQSQIAFYAADSGVECAQYWDLKNPNNPSKSAFDTVTAGSVKCNNNATVTTGSQTVLTYPTQASVVGGAVNSIFMVFFANSSCAIVKVTKNVDNTTTINSYGYNTCDTNALRRFERGITVTY